jgi:ligand-binding sensor domain-containing protein
MPVKLFVIIAVLFSVCSFAQDNFLFEHLGVEQGLSQNDVRCILQDSRGNIWIGTRSGGLNLFNGFSFRYFKAGSGPSDLARNEIFGLAEDKKGNIYVSHTFGLDRVNVDDGKVDRFHHREVSETDFVHTSRSTLLMDKENRIWIASSSGIALFDCDQEKYTYLDVKGLVGGIDRIEQTNNGDIWAVSTNNKLYRISDENPPEEFSIKASISDAARSSISMTVANDGNIVLASPLIGVVEFDPETNVTRDVYPALAQYLKDNKFDIDSIRECKHGRVWVAGRWDFGLLLYNPENDKVNVLKKSSYNSDGLLSNHIDCLAEDDSGNHWIGTRSGGATKISEVNFSRITPARYQGFGTISSTVRSISQDSKGNVWVGTDSDISMINRKNKSVDVMFKLNFGGRKTAFSSVYIMEELTPDVMLIGGIGIRLTLFNKKTGSATQLIKTGEVRHISKDSKGRYWISRGQWKNCKLDL